ncbi:MAG: hypothetical protein FWH21_07065 [Kiritimatiellaeota bacterium]|nr:hypothetical protein [Kiritimatiellota bacterium]
MTLRRACGHTGPPLQTSARGRAPATKSGGEPPHSINIGILQKAEKGCRFHVLCSRCH